MLHGCTIEKGALIGMGTTILNHAVIGENSLIGAGSLVTEGKVICYCLSLLLEFSLRMHPTYFDIMLDVFFVFLDFFFC